MKITDFLPKKLIEQPIDLEYNNNEFTYVLYDLNVINDIYKKVSSVVLGNEFQVGYEAICIELKKSDKIINVVIPTCYYNFKQKVDIAYIDYNLQDVQDRYLLCKNTVNIDKLNEVLITPLYNLEKYGFDVNVYRSDIGSIHRHPSKTKFSLTDLNKDPDNPGVIYRKSKYSGIQVDSILFVEINDIVTIFHTEARRVNVSTDDNGKLNGTYQKHSCICCYIDKSNIYNIHTIIDMLDLVQDNTIEGNYYYSDNLMKNVIVNSICETYLKSDFYPSIEYVDKSLITINDMCKGYIHQKLCNFIDLGDDSISFYDYAFDISTFNDTAFIYKNRLFDEKNNFINEIDGKTIRLSNK